MVSVSGSEGDDVALGLCGRHTYRVPVSITKNKVLTMQFVT